MRPQEREYGSEMFCPAYREAEKTRLLITTQTQRIVEKEAETERKRAIIGKPDHCFTVISQQSLCVHLCTHDPAVQTDVSDRGSEGGPGRRDPVPAEGDGERDGEKDL